MNAATVGETIDNALWQRAAVLYLPLVAALLLGLTQKRRPRRFAARLLSFLWTLPTLLVLQRLNQFAHWWSYPSGDLFLCGMPLELYFGWVVLWSILPQLAFPRLPLPWCAALLAAFDLIAMPLCSAVVHLGPRWLAGEAAALVLVLIPALSLARWTQNDSHLPARATLQIATSGLLFLFFVPELVFALRPGQHWKPLLEMPGWQREFALQLLVILALPGIGAVMEFAQRGHGTPIPYDPPKRLVTSGIYRYVANPMQLSCTLVMLLWATILHNPWLLIAPVLAIIYSAGIARWDEQQDLNHRFGAAWREYRSHVHNWLPRWRPHPSGEPAQLFIATTCGPCSQLQRWLELRSPIGLAILPAESLPANTIRRMNYDPSDGSPAVAGIRAMGRALEHLHLGWAIAGTALRLPGIWQLVQLLMDTSGLGPRTVRPASSQHQPTH